jgi:hypothetical protein
VRGQDQDGGCWEVLANLPGRFNAFCQIAWGHPDVDDGQIRAMLLDQVEQPGSVVCLADDVEA